MSTSWLVRAWLGVGAIYLSGSSLGCAPMPVAADAGSRVDAGPIDHDARVAPDAPPGLDASTATDAVSPADVTPPRCGLDADGPPPTFRGLHADVIAPYRCAECHHAGGSFGTLDLSSVELAYASLVGVVGCDGVMRVTPCDPSASTFAIVPTGRGEPCGVRHTSGGVFPTGIVTPEEAARIDAWIAAGAAF